MVLLAMAGVTESLASTAVLEEVIVTAQKRAQSLQDVPISMTAVSGTKIEDAGITNMQSLSGHVPGLQIGQGAINDNIFIRGIGSGNNRAFEQSVGMYIDGVYMGRSHQYRSPFLDVERVEVLRGPQGVLFGKNTVAGAINITTASAAPGDDFSGSVRAEYEPDQNTHNVTAAPRGSLSDTLAARLAVKSRESDGWSENKYLNQDETQSKEQTVRLSVAWDVTDSLSAALKLSHAKTETSGNPIVYPAFSPAADLAVLGANGFPLAPLGFTVLATAFPDFASTVGKDFTGYKNNDAAFNREGVDSEVDNLSLKLEWTLGDYSLTSVTGYSAYEYQDGLDSDFGPLTFAGSDNNYDFDQLSQEIRVASPIGETIEWVAGAYVEQQSLAWKGDVTIDSSFGQPDLLDQLTGNQGYRSLWQMFTGGAYGASRIGRHSDFKQDADTQSVFAQATWNVNDALRATLGVRYAKDTKTLDKSLVFSDDLQGLGRENYDPSYAAQPLQDAMWGLFNSYRHDYVDQKRVEEHATPAVNVEWDVNEDTMMYLSYSEGYKGGGFNGADDMTTTDTNGDGVGDVPASDFQYEDELAKTVELGGKLTLADGAMRLNWALFHTEFTNLQVTSFNGTGFTVGNAAQSTVEGVEAEWEWQASEALHIGANIAYLDYRYDNYATAPCTIDAQIAYSVAGNTDTCASDLSGKSGAFAPTWSSGLFVDYSHSLGDALTLKLGADANFKDKYYTDGSLEEATAQDAAWKFNVRAGIENADQTWALTVYGNNVTNEQTLTGSVLPRLRPSSSCQMRDVM